MNAVLEIHSLSKNFDALQVSRKINMILESGERRALIGPNGAGKTTFVNLLTGVINASSGSVLLNGEDIVHLPQAERARRGLVRTFQINQLFRGLTVLEHLYLAIAERNGICSRLWDRIGAERVVIDEALEHLELLNLLDDALKPVRELPYGRQRLVELAIAFAQRPKVLLLDEPAAGIPSSEGHLILHALDQLDSSIAIMIIEHDMDLVFRFAQRITVLVAGAIFAEGTPEEIMTNEEIRSIYLGQEVCHARASRD